MRSFIHPQTVYLCIGTTLAGCTNFNEQLNTNDCNDTGYVDSDDGDTGIEISGELEERSSELDLETCTSPKKWLQVKAVERHEFASISLYIDSVKGDWDNGNRFASASSSAPSLTSSFGTCKTDTVLIDCSVTSTMGYSIPNCGGEDPYIDIVLTDGEGREMECSYSFGYFICEVE